jgi:1-acyl-sn-glycerol-3-phosphate acyltransferase
MAAALALPQGIAMRGRLRIAVRLLGMLALLIAAIPLYYTCYALRRHNPVPRLFLHGVARLAGVQITSSGEKVHRGAFLLANHVSWIDIPALAAATGTAFVAHDGLAAMPLLKWLCAMNDTVFVARHDRASVARQIHDVRQALSDTGALTIFPEGTTSDGTGLLAFKSSLLSALEPLPAGIAVQPVLLDYGPEAAAIGWVGEEHGLHNFLRILARRHPVRLTLHFLPVLEGDQLANRKTIAAAARHTLLARLQPRPAG